MVVYDVKLLVGEASFTYTPCCISRATVTACMFSNFFFIQIFLGHEFGGTQPLLNKLTQLSRWKEVQHRKRSTTRVPRPLLFVSVEVQNKSEDE
jgi:hypothetical protein